jgi:cysteine desulfurase
MRVMWFFRQKRVYLDHASATPILRDAVRAIEDATRLVGNPGAIHREGVAAATLLDNAREKIARELGVKARELVFVSGGTEANNLAILGFARRLSMQGTDLAKTHWVVGAIEHPSVLECFAEIERLGGTVSHVDPGEQGIISPEAVARTLRKNTVFVSVQWANHEIGTVQPIRAIARSVREYETAHETTIVFHSDLGQAPLYVSPQVHTLGVDIASLDSGKLYGPRGVGCVYLANRVELAPVLLGGGQERGLRAGTENVALIAGFAESLAFVARERDKESRRVRELRDTLARDILARIPDAVVNGHRDHMLPHLLNVSVPNISSEYITLALDHAGIAIATKSACKEGEARSHVVAAITPDEGDAWRAACTLRFSLGRDTTVRDVNFAASTLAKKVAKFRM